MFDAQAREFFSPMMNIRWKRRVSRILFLVMITLFAGTVKAQDEGDEIPQNVVDAFEALYPKIKNVSWDFDELSYEASFKLDGKVMSLVFDELGYVNQVKNEIKQYELPVHVGQLLTKEYSGWRLGKASHIDSFGTDYYETVVEKEHETVILVFNQQGGLMIKLIQ